MLAMARDFGLCLNGLLRTDSTAALGMVHRQGLGRTRHIEVQYLWIQEQVAAKKFNIAKVDSKANPADLLTKHLNAEVMQAHMKELNMKFVEGRSDSALMLKAVVRSKEERKLNYEELRRAAKEKKRIATESRRVYEQKVFIKNVSSVVRKDVSNFVLKSVSKSRVFDGNGNDLKNGLISNSCTIYGDSFNTGSCRRVCPHYSYCYGFYSYSYADGMDAHGTRARLHHWKPHHRCGRCRPSIPGYNILDTFYFASYS